MDPFRGNTIWTYDKTHYYLAFRPLLARVAKLAKVNFIVGDPVIHRRSHIRGKVFEVSEYWGWFRVRFEDGVVRTYDGNLRSQDLAVRLDLDSRKESTNA